MPMTNMTNLDSVFSLVIAGGSFFFNGVTSETHISLE